VKAVVQLARNASVQVEGRVSGSISRGLLVYLGVSRDDTEKEAAWMAEKISNLRIFEDAGGKMNLSIIDLNEMGGEPLGILAVSQFTLLADLSRGRRPYYGEAADPVKAKALYEYFMEKVREQGISCEAGVFQARMDVSYTNEGPVTIIL
jgi:D-tyrosyl-tRNA(Tyr) deacylase